MIRAVLITAVDYDAAKIIAGATGYEDAIPTDQDGLYACTIDVAYPVSYTHLTLPTTPYL